MDPCAPTRTRDGHHPAHHRPGLRTARPPQADIPHRRGRRGRTSCWLDPGNSQSPSTTALSRERRIFDDEPPSLRRELACATDLEACYDYPRISASERRAPAGTRGGGRLRPGEDRRAAHPRRGRNRPLPRWRSGRVRGRQVLFQHSRAAKELSKFCNLGDIDITAHQHTRGALNRLAGTRRSKNAAADVRSRMISDLAQSQTARSSRPRHTGRLPSATPTRAPFSCPLLSRTPNVARDTRTERSVTRQEGCQTQESD